MIFNLYVYIFIYKYTEIRQIIMKDAQFQRYRDADSKKFRDESAVFAGKQLTQQKLSVV